MILNSSSNLLFYEIADVFFYILHLLIIGFNLFGWIWNKTLRLHLVVAGITILSWVGLGIFYGFGYCFITDWHWEIKNKLGETDLPASFVTYFFQSIGLPILPSTADTITMVSFTIAIIASIYRNIKK